MSKDTQTNRIKIVLLDLDHSWPIEKADAKNQYEAKVFMQKVDEKMREES